MLTFILRRLFSMIPLLFAVSLFVFILMYLAPGDFLDQARSAPDIPESTITQLERDFGLVNAEGEPTPWFVQYGRWLSRAVILDFGESWSYKIPVVDLLKQRVINTLLLSFCAITFAWCIAVPLGVLAAIRKDSIFDRLSSILAYAALSIPEFFLAILAVFFASVTGLFPIGGSTSVQSEFMGPGAQLLDRIHHLILPSVVLGIGSIASLMRVMRANFIDYMRMDFVTTARAKGLSEGVVMFKHVLRNAINPLITYFGFAFAYLLSGALLVENVMNYPGLGQLVFDALLREDQYVVMAAVLIGVFMLVMGNLLSDLLLAWTDPRIRLEDPDANKPISPMKISGGFAIIIGILLVEMGLEAWFPTGLAVIAITLKYTGIALGALLVLCCLSLIGYLIFTLGRTLALPVLRRPTGAVSVAVLAALYCGALFAPLLAPYEVNTQQLGKAMHPPTMLTLTDGGLAVKVYEKDIEQPGRYKTVEGQTIPLKFFAKGFEYKLFGLFRWDRHLLQPDTDDKAARLYLLGSDDTGRDIFSRLLYGSQVSLSVGLIGISITMVIGFLIGGMSGYLGGAADFWGMRLVEFLMSIPGLYLLLAMRSALVRPDIESTQMYVIIIACLALIGWAGTARIIRGMTLSIRNRQFVLAAENLGLPAHKVLIRHILPNLASYLLVAATLSIPGYILGEAALSFLGLGIMEPSASWGLMLKQSQSDMRVFFMNLWWLLTPGFAIFITVIAFNVLGDVLRDVVDPRMKTL